MSKNVELNVVIKSEVDEDSFNQSEELLQTLQAGADAFVDNWNAQCIKYRETCVALNKAFAKALDEPEPEPDPETCKIWLNGNEYEASDITLNTYCNNPHLSYAQDETCRLEARADIMAAFDEAYREGGATVIIAKGLAMMASDGKGKEATL